ncbi:hypothetical protein F2Q70_00042369 [Brassica cretica]|uniref:Uncharacterized protein n=1 Tax=Brassica cretica TaxID=69181 RepID=A0A8S9KII4_BRACR|nr:hypothetical protein F2Q70_00042369 [Brassica cretica]
MPIEACLYVYLHWSRPRHPSRGVYRRIYYLVQTMCMYIEALPTRQSDGSGFNNLSSRRDDVLSKLNKELDTTVQLLRSYEENQVPASDFQGPTPGSGPCLRLPGSYPRELTNSTAAKVRIHTKKTIFIDMPNNRRIPAITINQMKFYAHCSTSTTPSTGLGHDLMSISRNAPCSLKHIDTSCSL